MIVIILISPVNASQFCLRRLQYVSFLGCLAPISAQASTTTSTAVANVQVSMYEKVSINLHGTTICRFASLSMAVDEAQCCTGLDDAILFKMDAGPVQRLAHGDHREVSVEFNRSVEVKRRLQEQRRTSEGGHGLVSTGSYCLPKKTHIYVYMYTQELPMLHRLQVSSKKSCFCRLRNLSVFPISPRPSP